MRFSWSLAGQIAVVCILFAVLAAPFVGKFLKRRRVNRERAERSARVRQLVSLANEYESAVSPAERTAIYRKAQSLGFTEEEESRPFALDENEQPHLPRAS